MVGVWDGMKLGWIPTDGHSSQSYPKIPMIRRCSTILPKTFKTLRQKHLKALRQKHFKTLRQKHLKSLRQKHFIALKQKNFETLKQNQTSANVKIFPKKF